jgi:hypothetical protein
MNSKIAMDDLRRELSVTAKNGLDFILAASLIWLLIAFIWSWESADARQKSIYTFMVGALFMPMAWVFSKIVKTTWTLKDNPLDSLGLWLNFAQLFYFPFLFFFLSKMPEYFIMAYAVVTGAHFFPYSWYYHNKWYALAAGVISVGALLMGTYLPFDDMFLLPLGMSGVLALLCVALYADYRRKAL